MEHSLRAFSLIIKLTRVSNYISTAVCLLVSFGSDLGYFFNVHVH